MTPPRWIWLILILGLALGYANSLPIGFELDDAYLITANPHIRTLANIPRFFVDPSMMTPAIPLNQDIRPTLVTTYALNYAISGLNPWSYHVLGLLIHLGVSVLVFLLVRDYVWRDGGDVGAAVAALVFALSPLNGQPIIYQSARSVSLMALFYLGAFYLILKDRLGWGVLCHALALLTKAVAVTFPVALVLYLLVFPKPWMPVDRDPFPAYLRRRRLWLAVCLTWVLDVAYMWYRHLVGAAGPAPATGSSSWTWTMTSWSSYVDYARRFVWPSDLSIDHQNVWTTSLMHPRAWLSLMALVACAVLAITCRIRWPHLVFALSFYLLALAPESTLIPLGEVQNDHRPYLASALGLSVLVAWAIKWAVRERALVPVCLLLGLAATAVTVHRNYLWQDSVRLWQHTAMTDPGNPRAWMNAGVGLMARGRFPEARHYFEEAKARAPQYAYIYANLSILDGAEGKKESSLANAQTAVALAPTWQDARGYLEQAEKRLRTP